MPQRPAVVAVGLVVGTILLYAWLGPLAIGVGAVSAILYFGGEAWGAGNYWWGAYGGDKGDALRSQLARRRFEHTEAEEYDEEAWARARERRHR